MSDTFITLVPDNVNNLQVQELANKILNHLTQKGIVKNGLTECTLGNKGYEPGDKFMSVIDENDLGLQDLHTNGLEMKKTKEVFHNGSNGLDEINCPNCKTNIIDSDWGQALDEWTNETGKDKITCPNCKSVNSITEYKFEPNWGFGNLALTFWNWPSLKEGFIKDIEKLIERKIRIIYGRL